MDPLGASADPESPQTWNRYTYGENNPIRMVDPTGEDPSEFALWLDLLTRLLAESAGEFSNGYLSGGLNSVGSEVDPVVPGAPATQSGEDWSVAYQAGVNTGEFVATHDLVIEASVTADTGNGPAVTAGLATVNGNDNYIFAGGGDSRSLLPASVTVSAGVVEHYNGVGDYRGIYYNVISSAPLGTSVAADWRNPKGCVSFELTATTDIGGPSQMALFYQPIGTWTPH